MIKAASTAGNGRKLLLFGLSRLNIERLQKGNPIWMGETDLAEMGISGFDICICAGETEATIMAELADLVGPETKLTGETQ